MCICPWSETIGLKIKVTQSYLYNTNFREKMLFNRQTMSMPIEVKEKWVYNELHSPFSTISTGVINSGKLQYEHHKRMVWQICKSFCHGWARLTVTFSLWVLPTTRRARLRDTQEPRWKHDCAIYGHFTYLLVCFCAPPRALHWVTPCPSEHRCRKTVCFLLL